MPRSSQRSLATIIAFALLTATFFSVPTPVSANAEVMQCMIDCIKSEGKAEKATCKSRCANVPVSADPQNHDCMAIYKQCKTVCESDQECRKICKNALLNCV